MDIKLEQMEKAVRKRWDCAIYVYQRELATTTGFQANIEDELPNSTIPFSLPNISSNGRPVSLHIGNGMYCSSPLAFVICSFEAMSAVDTRFPYCTTVRTPQHIVDSSTFSFVAIGRNKFATLAKP